VADLAQLLLVPGPLAVICHDAGATNTLLAWIEAVDRVADCLPVMQGPAAVLWQRRFPDGPAPVTLEQALACARTVISGTGWASDLEHRSRQLAREQGIASIAVIDHWTNYRQRFERGGVIVLPDRIWVADAEACALARELLPEVPVEQLPATYLRSEALRIAPVPDGHATLLYVLEPMKDNWGRDALGEFQALDFLVQNLDALDVPPQTPIRLRPHPSDPVEKYDAWIASNAQFDVALDRSDDLSCAISSARWVAGCQSFALVIAMEAGRQTICTLPHWAPTCVLPHDKLLHLKDCVARS